MPMPKSYKALLIRQDARQLIDDVKSIMEKDMGLSLNYSQVITLLCKKYGFDIVNKDGEIVESDHDSSYACLSNCIDNAELLIDGRVDFLKESENV